MLKSFIHIRKKLTITKNSPSEIVGLIVPDRETISHLNKLSINSCINDYAEINNKTVYIDDLQESTSEIEISLFPKQITNGKYFEKKSDFLNTYSQSKPSLEYYIHEIEYHSDSEPCEFIKNHQDTILLITLLQEICDHSFEKAPYSELVFLREKKISIITSYTINDLTTLPNIDELTRQLTKTHDKKERETIFISEIEEITEKLGNSITLGNLLKSLNEIYNRYTKSHYYYIKKFSFEKIKTELDDKRASYISKIQSILNESQTKIVAIPAAFIFVLSQFDYTGVDVYKNIALTIGSTLFSYLLDILTRNQFASIKFIEKDIISLKEKFSKNKEIHSHEEFESTFTTLLDFATKQKGYLKIIRLSIWLITISTAILFTLTILDIHSFEKFNRIARIIKFIILGLAQMIDIFTY